MRVNVDSSVFTDARFKLLAKRLGITHHDAIGKCVHVWMSAFEQRTGVLHAEEVDALVDKEGFSDALIHSRLAREESKLNRQENEAKSNDREANAKLLQIAGWNDRAAWLNEREASGRKGGLQSGVTRRKKSKNAEGIEANAKQTRSKREANAKLTRSYAEPSSSSSSPDQDISPDLAAAPERSADREALQNFAPTQQQQQRAVALNLDPESERQKFVAHAKSTGRKIHSLDDAFTLWLEKSWERKQRTQTEEASKRGRFPSGTDVSLQPIVTKPPREIPIEELPDLPEYLRDMHRKIAAAENGDQNP